MTIFILKDGNRLGPFTVEQAASSIRKGEFLMTDLAWHEGISEWKPIHMVSNIVNTVMPPTPNLTPIQPKESDHTPTSATDAEPCKSTETPTLALENVNVHTRTHTKSTLWKVVLMASLAVICICVGIPAALHSWNTVFMCCVVGFFICLVLLAAVSDSNYIRQRSKVDKKDVGDPSSAGTIVPHDSKVAGGIRIFCGLLLILIGVGLFYALSDCKDKRKSYPLILAFMGIGAVWSGVKQMRGKVDGKDDSW